MLIIVRDRLGLHLAVLRFMYDATDAGLPASAVSLHE